MKLASKRRKNFNIYIVFKKKRKKKNTSRYHYFTPQSSDLQFLSYRTCQTEIGNFGSFIAFTWLKCEMRFLKK